MSDSPIQTFVALSAILTGFSPDRFAPAVDPANLAQDFFDFIMRQEPDTFTRLLELFTKAKDDGTSPDDLAEAFSGAGSVSGLTVPDDCVKLALSINKLWYLGTWYDPTSPDTQTVVSDQAYIRGLAWFAMQSHAMGNSPFTYGYWAEDPAASLALTTGNPAVETSGGAS